jgi:hypothetical protein
MFQCACIDLHRLFVLIRQIGYFNSALGRRLRLDFIYFIDDFCFIFCLVVGGFKVTTFDYFILGLDS